MSKFIIHRVIIVQALLCFVGTSMVFSQGTSTDSLVLRNTSGGRTTLIPGAGVPLATPWYLTLPNNVGSTNSLLLSNVTGSNATLSWLTPGPDNTVLTMTSGSPQWVAGANWLLTGNTAVNEVTQFLGTTDANDLVIRSNNLIRMRVNQEFNQGIDVSRPTTGNGAYNVMNLGMNMQNGAAYSVSNDNTRVFINSVDWGAGGPGGAAQVGTFYSNWTRLWMQRAPGTTYNDLVGDYFHWQANNAAAINSITGYWSERRTGATNNTVGTLYQFRAELPGNGTVNNLFGFFMGTPAGTLNNVAAFAANNIPTGAGNRYFLTYNATGANAPFTVSADGSITSGTLTPLANSRVLITALPATSGRAIDVDMTGTTTSSGLVIREIGATGSNDAGILIGTAATGTGTGIRISGVAGFNAPNTGIDMIFSTTGINAVPRSTANGVGVSVGSFAGNRARIGGEFYSRASGTDAFGVYADVNATGVPTSVGIGGYLATSGNTGSLFPLVVSSANNNDVFLGSTTADRPAALTTLLTGAATQNNTYMFNARLSGSATFVGSTSGLVSLTAPATITTYSMVLPNAAGTAGQVLSIASVAGPVVTLGWGTAPPLSPYEEATAFQRNVRRITSLISGPAAVPGYQATDLQSSRTLATQTASANQAFIGGGQNNTASGQNSGILAGDGNIAGAGEALVVAGQGNNVTAAAWRGLIVGGTTNTVSANHALIVGGQSNVNSANLGLIVGGNNNNASGNKAVIVGGENNTNSANIGFLGGGSGNSNSGNISVVVGGQSNSASGDRAAIVGGSTNTISGARSFIGGGNNNSISANLTAVAGGENIVVTGQYVAVPGGQNLTINANNIFAFNSGAAITISSQNTAVFANNDLWLANTNNTASQLRLYEPQSTTGAFPSGGTNFAAFRAGTMAADNVYTLPTAVGTVGQVLKIVSVAGNDATTQWQNDNGGPVIQNVTVNAATAININAGVTYLRLTSTVAPAAAPVTFVPPALYAEGTVLVVRIIGAAAANGVTFTDGAGAPNEFILSGNFQPQNDDTITFVYDATTTSWVEISRRNN